MAAYNDESDIITTLNQAMSGSAIFGKSFRAIRENKSFMKRKTGQCINVLNAMTTRAGKQATCILQIPVWIISRKNYPASSIKKLLMDPSLESSIYTIFQQHAIRFNIGRSDPHLGQVYEKSTTRY